MTIGVSPSYLTYCCNGCCVEMKSWWCSKESTTNLNQLIAQHEVGAGVRKREDISAVNSWTSVCIYTMPVGILFLSWDKWQQCEHFKAINYWSFWFIWYSKMINVCAVNLCIPPIQVLLFYCFVLLFGFVQQRGLSLQRVDHSLLFPAFSMVLQTIIS